MTEVNLTRNTGLPSLGTHLFKIIRFSEHAGTEFPYWRYICQIQDQGPDKGKEVMLQLSLSPSARWKMDEFLDAVKAPGQGKANGESYVGKMFRANGELDIQRNKVNLVTMMSYDSQMTFGETSSEVAPTPQPVSALPDEFPDDVNDLEI